MSSREVFSASDLVTFTLDKPGGKGASTPFVGVSNPSARPRLASADSLESAIARLDPQGNTADLIRGVVGLRDIVMGLDPVDRQAKADVIAFIDTLSEIAARPDSNPRFISAMVASLKSDMERQAAKAPGEEHEDADAESDDSPGE